MRFLLLMRQNAKYRGWEIILSVFLCLLLFPVLLWLYLAKMKMSIETADMSQIAQKTISVYFSVKNIPVKALTIFMSLLGSIQTMGYLFSKEKVDFYHSMPVKRERLFLCGFVNSMLLYLIPLTISVFLGLGVGKCYAQDVDISYRNALYMLGLQFVGYLTLYSINGCVILVTGRKWIALLGIAGVNVIGLFYYMIAVLYEQTWLSSAYMYEDESSLWRFSSPVLNFSMLFLKNSIDETILFFGLLVMGVAAFVVSWIFYKKRQLENVNKGIMYHPLKTFIKIVLNAWVGIACVFVVYDLISMMENKVFQWMALIINYVFCMFVAYAILQLVLEQDVKTCKRDWKVLVSSVIVSAIWVLAFKCDVLSINRYIPKEEQIASFSFAYELDPDCQYRLEHMKGKEIQTARALAELGVEKSKGHPWLVIDSDDEKIFYLRFSLKNGKTVTRKYLYVENEAFMEKMECITNTEEYQDAVYLRHRDKIRNLLVMYNEDEEYWETVIEDSGKIEACLQALEQDLAESCYNRNKDGDFSWGEICLYGKDNDLEEKNYYEINASYRHTIAFLKKYGYIGGGQDDLD